MSAQALRDLAALPEDDEYRYDQTSLAPLVRLAGAIRVTSIASDGLFDVDDLDAAKTRSKVVGYVELGLDYHRYDAQLIKSILLGTGFTGITFLALMGVGWTLLRRAVKPLVDLQSPLRQLAEGASHIDVPVSHHREIGAIAGALERAAARVRDRDQSLRRLADYDDLTGLPNRRHFEELLAAELVSVPHQGASGALLFLDLDHFKNINDTVSHRTGDVVLRQLAARLSHAMREHDVVGRFGGDEFVVLLRNASDTAALAAAERLQKEIRDYPVVCEHRSFSLDASIGVTPLRGRFTAEELLAQADLACHQAKADGRGLVRVFEPGAGAVEDLKTVVDQVESLKQALREDRFELYFQPIMSLASGQYSHYEVLLRLLQDGEVISPGAFLGAAQRFGLMADIDRWVIRRAFERLAELRLAEPDLRFTINVSGASFADGKLDAFVAAELAEHGLDPGAVVFEITEQVAVGSLTAATRQIRALMALGCEFAIDDFGAGYSSLNYLKQLPMQYIKIDGAFIGRLIDSPVDQVIVRSIAEIAHSLGKRTVAEFVGSEATVALLRRLGIDYAQGFHIGRPAPVVAVASRRRDVG